jgi:RimJ/RimL family protein N-acetyltransferase
MKLPVIETERLRLFALSDESASDAQFMLRLLNDAAFIRNINDRGVRTLQEAAAYLHERIVPAYAERGFGMFGVETKNGGICIGTCGLLRREGLDGPDIGYAFLPEYTGCGYAREAARGVVQHVRDTLGPGCLYAIVNPDNAASIRLLQHLRFAFAKMIRLPGIDHDLRLFSLNME